MIPQPKKQKQKFSLNNIDDINIKKVANKEEEKIAKLLGGRKTIKSGAVKFDPADISLADSIVEIKSALKQKQIIVKESMLNKLLKESMRVGKEPVMILNFSKSDLRIKKWILIPYE